MTDEEAARRWGWKRRTLYGAGLFLLFYVGLAAAAWRRADSVGRADALSDHGDTADGAGWEVLTDAENRPWRTPLSRFYQERRRGRWDLKDRLAPVGGMPEDLVRVVPEVGFFNAPAEKARSAAGSWGSLPEVESLSTIAATGPVGGGKVD